MTTLAVIGDMHCGHRAGLTPPDWWQAADTKPGKLQRECWKWFVRSMAETKPDVLAVCGDAIEGKGDYSGGVECLTTDRLEQVEMAAECIAATGAKKIVMVAGTACHVGDDGEDFEEVLAAKVKAIAFSGQEFFETGGVVFHLKHHLGSSTIPHGRFTAMARDNMWQELWAAHNRQPRADVILRGHCHYFGHCGNGNWLGINLPALQAAATKFGRRCSGLVDFGYVEFDCKKGDYTWRANLLAPVAERAKLLRI